MIKVTKNNIHITDGYAVGKFGFEPLLRDTAKKHPECVVFRQRKMKSLVLEWTVHNFLYMVGYQRKRTKDVDLDFPCDKPEWLYIVLGRIVWIFIR